MECFLEAFPFVFDNLPIEAGLKDALRHHRQIAIVGDFGELLWGQYAMRQQLFQRSFAAFALFGKFADCLEWSEFHPGLQVHRGPQYSTD